MFKEGMSEIVQTRINAELRDDLAKIAAESFEGNMSMVIRLALREFRDRRLRRHETRSADRTAEDRPS